MDYQQYLSNIPQYRKANGRRAALGAAIFLYFWGSVMSLMETITKSSVQEDGNVSNLVVWLVRTTVYMMWFSHDRLFAPIFGRGDGLRESRKATGANHDGLKQEESEDGGSGI